MRQLIIGELVAGGYYARPVDWAGIWDTSGKLESGNVVFKSSSKEECKNYVLRQRLVELIDENPNIRVIPIITKSTESISLFGYTKRNLVDVRLDECYSYKNTLYIRSKHSEEQVIMDRKVLDTDYSVIDESRPIIVWEKCILVYIE